MAIDSEKLWKLVTNGSPTVAAMALLVLDEQLGGKISELKKKMEGGNRNGYYNSPL
jgi:hypothetical protein